MICGRLEGDSFRLNHPGTRAAPRRRRDEAVQTVLYSVSYKLVDSKMVSRVSAGSRHVFAVNAHSTEMCDV